MTNWREPQPTEVKVLNRFISRDKITVFCSYRIKEYKLMTVVIVMNILIGCFVITDTLET